MVEICTTLISSYGNIPNSDDVLCVISYHLAKLVVSFVDVITVVDAIKDLMKVENGSTTHATDSTDVTDHATDCRTSAVDNNFSVSAISICLVSLAMDTTTSIPIADDERCTATRLAILPSKRSDAIYKSVDRFYPNY